MASITVKNASNIDTPVELPNANGRAAAAASRPVVLSNEDKTALDAINTLQGAVTETAPTSDTASSGLNGRLQRIAQRITSLIALLPAALGANGGLKVDIVGRTFSSFAAFRLLSAATGTNLTLVKGSAGSIGFIQGYNNSTSALYLKLYNVASTGGVTVGTTTPFMTLRLPAKSDFIFSYGSSAPVFATGCVMALTTGVADNSTTGVAVAADIEALTIGTF